MCVCVGVRVCLKPLNIHQCVCSTCVCVSTRLLLALCVHKRFSCDESDFLSTHPYLICDIITMGRSDTRTCFV